MFSCTVEITESRVTCLEKEIPKVKLYLVWVDEACSGTGKVMIFGFNLAGVRSFHGATIFQIAKLKSEVTGVMSAGDAVATPPLG